MRLLLILSILQTSVLKAQNSYGVLGNLSTDSYGVFTFDSLDKNCMLDYATAFRATQTEFFIISDTSCKFFSQRYYRVIVPEGIRYMQKIHFRDTATIDSLLLIAYKQHPSLQERASYGMTAYKNILAQRQKTEDSLNKIAAKEAADEMKAIQKSLDSVLLIYQKYNWVLWQWSWSYPNEYSSFPDVYIEVINPFKKKIKYISFTLDAKNPVGDPISGHIKTVQGIGPIEYGDHASYNFESVFYSKVIGTIQITQIRIQFFDGTIKVISKPREVHREDDE